MSKVDVEALRGLLAESTPGPWRLEVDESWGDKDTSVVSDKGVICCDTQYYPTAVAPNDQALIAAAITALLDADGRLVPVDTDRAGEE